MHLAPAARGLRWQRLTTAYKRMEVYVADLPDDGRGVTDDATRPARGAGLIRAEEG